MATENVKAGDTFAFVVQVEGLMEIIRGAMSEDPFFTIDTTKQ